MPHRFPQQWEAGYVPYRYGLQIRTDTDQYNRVGAGDRAVAGDRHVTYSSLTVLDGHW